MRIRKNIIQETKRTPNFNLLCLWDLCVTKLIEKDDWYLVKTAIEMHLQGLIEDYAPIPEP